MYRVRWRKFQLVVGMLLITSYGYGQGLQHTPQQVEGFGFVAQSANGETDKIYLVDGGHIACLNLKTGGLIWSAKAPGLSSQGIPGVGPVLAGPTLAYMGGGGFFTLYGMDKYTGRTKWTLEQRSPTLAHNSDALFLSTQGGLGVIGVNADTGKIKWKHRAVNVGGTLTRIVYSDGRLYTDSPYIWDAGTGRLIGKLSFNPSVVVEEKGQVFMTGYDMPLVSVNAHTGKMLWKAPNPIPESPATTPDDYLAVSRRYLVAAFYDDQAFMAKNGVVQVYDAVTGKLLWQKTIISSTGLVSDPVSVDREFVYLLESYGSSRKGSKITAFNVHSGKQVWTYSEPVGFLGPIVSIGGTVLANTAGQPGSVNHTSLYALDRKTGMVRWKFVF